MSQKIWLVWSLCFFAPWTRWDKSADGAPIVSDWESALCVSNHINVEVDPPVFGSPRTFLIHVHADTAIDTPDLPPWISLTPIRLQNGSLATVVTTVGVPDRTVKLTCGGRDTIMFTQPPYCQGVSRAKTEMEIFEGATYTLRCAARRTRGRLPPLNEIYWRHDETRLGRRQFHDNRFNFRSDGTVTLTEAELWDSGVYTCVAVRRHSGGQVCVTESKINLKVLRKLVNPLKSVCGRQSTGRVPWMAMLYSKSTGKQFCGGSLVANEWVATAAHCYDEYPNRRRFTNDVRVVLGRKSPYVRESGELVFNVREHNKPRRRGVADRYDKDIMLLRLDEKVTQYTSTISPICLPEVAVRPVERGLMTGWGLRSAVLRRYWLPVKDDQICRRYKPRDNTFTSNMFCAGHGNNSNDICKGDSGGPFAINRSGQWFLGGIVSFGNPCYGGQNVYGYYTRVWNFYDWIWKTIFTSSVDDDHYDYFNCDGTGSDYSYNKF